MAVSTHKESDMGFILIYIFSALFFGIIRSQTRDASFKSFLLILLDIIAFPVMAVIEAYDKYGNPLS